MHGWMDGWMSLSSDFSFVSITTSMRQSKPASRSGLPQYARWTVEAHPDCKRYVLDCYSIGSLAIANQLGDCHVHGRLTCDQVQSKWNHERGNGTSISLDRLLCIILAPARAGRRKF